MCKRIVRDSHLPWHLSRPRTSDHVKITTKNCCCHPSLWTQQPTPTCSNIWQKSAKHPRRKGHRISRHAYSTMCSRWRQGRPETPVAIARYKKTRSRRLSTTTCNMCIIKRWRLFVDETRVLTRRVAPTTATRCHVIIACRPQIRHSRNRPYSAHPSPKCNSHC